jgi:hypothetical protein
LSGENGLFSNPKNVFLTNSLNQRDKGICITFMAGYALATHTVMFGVNAAWIN